MANVNGFHTDDIILVITTNGLSITLSELLYRLRSEPACKGVRPLTALYEVINRQGDDYA